MRSHTAVLLLGTLAVGCFGDCQLEQPLWRTHHGRGLGLQPIWRDSPFDDLISMFDDGWLYHHQIFSIGHDGTSKQPHQLEGEERTPSRCQGLENARNQEEIESRQRLAELDREEDNLRREQQQKATQYKEDKEEFQLRQERINQLRAETSTKQQLQRERRLEDEQRKEQERKNAEEQLLQQQREKREREQRREEEIKAKRAEYGENQRRKAKQQRRQQAKEREQMKRTTQHKAASRQTLNAEIAKHRVEGYDPDDLTVTVGKGRVKIEGNHICHCGENCITREFTRSYPLPAGVTTDTISATLDSNGIIKVLGEQSADRNIDHTSASIKVKGLDIPQSTKPSAEQLRKCLSKKGGIKLTKINKRTGEKHVDNYKYDHELYETARENEDEGDLGEGFVETEY